MFLMILLRVAIGWHLLFEGYTKLAGSDIVPRPGIPGIKENRFSAEMYLRNSSGPLRFYFRDLVDDFHGLGMLDQNNVEQKWNNFVFLALEKNPLDDEANERIEEKQKTLKESLGAYLKEKAGAIQQYKDDVQAWEAEETRFDQAWRDAGISIAWQIPFTQQQWQEHKASQAKLDTRRNELTGPILAWTDELVATVDAEGQRKRAASTKDLKGELGPLESAADEASVPPRRTKPAIDWRPELTRVELTTMWGLAVCGGLMVLGLFTRFACLGGAVLLTLFYLAMPPWPGLELPPNAEGTYLYVNKNLIEVFACLMLASSPVGVWGGLDSIIRGMITRPLFGVGRREAVRADAGE